MSPSGREGTLLDHVVTDVGDIVQVCVPELVLPDEPLTQVHSRHPLGLLRQSPREPSSCKRRDDIFNERGESKKT